MADTPIRIQRRRARGYRMPEGVVYVGRPSRWGNPYRPGDPDPMEPGRYLDGPGAVRMYRWYLESRPDLKQAARRDLRGVSLACWCPVVLPDGRRAPCHADVLLEVANA